MERGDGARPTATHPLILVAPVSPPPRRRPRVPAQASSPVSSGSAQGVPCEPLQWFRRRGSARSMAGFASLLVTRRVGSNIQGGSERHYGHMPRSNDIDLQVASTPWDGSTIRSAASHLFAALTTGFRGVQDGAVDDKYRKRRKQDL